MLAIAHAFETFGGYAPCTLCLRQREVYWVALGLALGFMVATILKYMGPALLHEFERRINVYGTAFVVLLVGGFIALRYFG